MHALLVMQKVQPYCISVSAQATNIWSVKLFSAHLVLDSTQDNFDKLYKMIIFTLSNIIYSYLLNYSFIEGFISHRLRVEPVKCCVMLPKVLNF